MGSTTIGDKATLSGGSNISRGTIHFTLDTPSATGLDEGTVTVVAGQLVYTAPNTVNVTEFGTYTWHASYSGDGLNNGAIDDGKNESLTSQKASPSVSTQIQVTGDGTVGSTTIEPPR